MPKNNQNPKTPFSEKTGIGGHLGGHLGGQKSSFKTLEKGDILPLLHA